MAAAHSSLNIEHHTSLYPLGNVEHLDHVPLDDVSHEEALTVDDRHVLLNTNSHQSHDIGRPHAQPDPTNEPLADLFMEDWDRMMNELCAAPVLPSLEYKDERKGSTATVQKFYEGRPTCKCCVNWVEKQPAKVPDEAQEKYDGVAIRIYHSKDHSKATLGGLKTVSPQWLVIQSPVIIKALEPIFKGIGRASSGKGSVHVNAPFQDLFFAYSGILAAYGEYEQGSEEKQHLGVLKEVTDELLCETTSEVSDLQAKKLITHHYLWTLFPKGIIVVSKEEGKECLFEVTSYDTSTSTVNCQYVAFDGFNYGVKRKNFTELYFWGTRAIYELNVYPLSFHKSREDLERHTIQRSRKVLRYQETMHADYGQSEVGEDIEQRSRHHLAVSASLLGFLRPHFKVELMRKQIGERIIIDPYGCRTLGHGLSVARLTSDNANLDDELRIHFERQVSKSRPSAERIRKNVEIVSSKPHWLLLLSPFIAGYSLKRHEFGKRLTIHPIKELGIMMMTDTFYVDYISSVKWNDWAFERLVFPEDSKDLLLTLVKNHGQLRDIGQDIIPGKGNGFVVLLSGPPGTGKTLTAEAAKRPFFRIQAETFGREDECLEDDLEEAFKLASEWNALLLIDEADAYLGNGKHSYERSSLVRILMTRLEYYSGVLFLTTNFPEKIDEAFSSRIDVHFEYPALDRTSRCRLLKTITEFARTSNTFAQPNDLTEQDYWGLARWKLNGRELKNAVKISSRLCAIKKEKLSYRGLETAIRHTAQRKSIEPEASPLSAKRARSS
ncbi:MAG: hypothetical protein Q9160_005153 [Pyrenula sp. 1 TL-2023]